jgi:hypothetical protein
MLGRLRFVEIQSGFSRASRSPALRRLAKLAPLASAREYLLRLFQNRARLWLTQHHKSQNSTTIFSAPRHYAASGLLNLPTSLAEAVVSATPGRGTAFVENERRKSSVEKNSNA